MHPEVRSDQSGSCPKCGMPLQEARDETKTPQHEQMPRMDDHKKMIIQMRAPWLWTNFTVMSLGLWLATSPFTFGYAGAAMMVSDVVSGILLMLLAGLALLPRWDFAGRWGVSLIGTWLQIAPLIFWAPSPAAMLNDTLIGAVAIGLSILVPMMPGMAHHMEMMKPGPEIPPAWTYNPSSWHQRAPMIALATTGWFISRYLAAYQFHYIPQAWDPFFGDSTQKVLTSKVSQMWPVSDAGLGAAAYTFEMLMGWMGGVTRWRSMPWMVMFFFLLVVPLGLTHITLVILQPVAVGQWCTLCLAAASVMLIMIPLTVDEVFATAQFLKRSVQEGKPFWRTFWVGGTLDGEENKDERTPHYGAPISKMWAPMVWGVSVPWTLAASALLGVWLMFAPAVFRTRAAAADSDHLVGAIVVTISVIVMAEVIRAGRFLNVLLGLWIAIAPWILNGATSGGRWNDVVAGLLIAALAFPRGPVRDRYAAWDRMIV
ncbi:MAG: SPW repeat protein [Bryobacteraceae bacterium]|nr:SPW repeat protein [Bryobacteraceae bacterium]